jgi:hypothetical protein
MELQKNCKRLSKFFYFDFILVLFFFFLKITYPNKHICFCFKHRDTMGVVEKLQDAFENFLFRFCFIFIFVFLLF